MNCRNPPEPRTASTGNTGHRLLHRVRISHARPRTATGSRANSSTLARRTALAGSPPPRKRCGERHDRYDKQGGDQNHDATQDERSHVRFSSSRVPGVPTVTISLSPSLTNPINSQH